MSHRTTSKYGYSEYDGVEIPVDDIENNIAHYNLYDIPMEPRRKIKFHKTKRDHNGDMMTHKDQKLANRGLYQRSKFMSPVIMSASLDVKKDALVNLVKQHYKAMKKKANKVDNTMETIMLQVVREEAER